MPDFLQPKSNTSRKSLNLTVLLLLAPLFFLGQSLTGLWIGTISNDSQTLRKDQSFEIALTEYRGKVYGYSRSEFIVNDTLYYIVKRVKGSIEGDLCEVTDDEIVAYNFRGRLDKGIKVTSTFRRNSNDSTWYLEGTWKTNATKRFYAVTGKVDLSEEKDLAASKIFPHLEELNLADKVVFYRERKENQQPPLVRIVKPEKNSAVSAATPAKEMLDPDVVHVSVADPVNMKRADAVVTEDNIMAAVKKPGENLSKTETGKPAAANTDVHTEAPVLSQANNKISNNPAGSTITTGQAPASKKPETVQPPTGYTARTDNKTQPVVTGSSTTTRVTNTPVSDHKKPVEKNTTPQTNTSVPANNAVAKQDETGKREENTTIKTIAKPVAPEKREGTPSFTADGDKPVVNKPDITVKAAVVEGRKSEFTQEVSFKSDSLVIALYDNGVIDGDTVSVYMNGEVLMSRQGLKASAIKQTIYLTPGKDDEFTLVLFAENLGQYPPNTGLLVVRDGNDVYNLRFSADLQKNAGVIFRRKN